MLVFAEEARGCGETGVLSGLAVDALLNQKFIRVCGSTDYRHCTCNMITVESLLEID